MPLSNQVAGVTEADQSLDQAMYPDQHAQPDVSQSVVQDSGIDIATTSDPYSLSAAIGLFNIVAGLMLVAAFLMFFGGLAAYFSRLGLVNRLEGLQYMHWGVTILFVLIILLAIVHTFQTNPALMYAAVALVVIVFAIWAITTSIREGAGGHDEEEH